MLSLARVAVTPVASDDIGLPDAEVLFEEAACGLLVTSRDGIIRRVNKTFCRWMGYCASELVGLRRIQDLLTMGGRIFHQTHWAPLLQIQGSCLLYTSPSPRD